MKNLKTQRVKMRKSKILYFLLVVFPLSTQNIFAAEAGDDPLYSVAKFMVVLTLVMILLVLWLALVYAEKNDNRGDLLLKPFKKLIQYSTMATPIEKEKEILMSHDYDGIRELDNRIPPWFHALFWGTIIFAVVYMIQFHVIGSGDVQAEEYRAEMKAAAMEREILIKTGAFLNEETVTFKDDAPTLQQGEEIFNKNCAACHATDGGGLVGPNLTDKYWIHGGGIKNIFTVIKYGVPQKGMISWESQLNPNEMQAVASYIMTLEGTEPANPKAPEGDVWTPPSENNED